MRFTAPWWLAAGLLACLLLLGLWRVSDARRQAALARFVAAHLRRELTQSISVAKRRTQRGLLLAAVALLCAALAGPQFGYRWVEITRHGNDIVFAIDTSRSMSTPDIKPSRLARAKLAIDDFAQQLDGDAVGIVAFAGSAFLVCPLTLDYGAFRESLSAIDTNTIARGGTNISSAIAEAQAALRRRPGSDRILILITDGEDLEGSAVAAAQTAKQQDGLTIYAVGVGTASGDLIPIPAEQGGGFVKDATGEFVKSRLDEPSLKALAAATGGFYVPLGVQGEGLETIYKSVLGPLAKHQIAALLSSLLFGTRRTVRRGHAQRSGTVGGAAPGAAVVGGAAPGAAVVGGAAPGASAVGAAATGAAAVGGAATGGTAVVGSATRGAVAGAPAAARFTASSVLPLALLTLLTPHRAHADTWGADQAYHKGDYASAEQAYAAAARNNPSAPILQYDLGDAQYKAGKFPQAAQAFQQSIANAPASDTQRLAVQQDAYYNLGNALYREGQKTAQTAPQDTLQKWNAAVKAYETALQLRADDADSKFNRDLVKRKIAALQQQQNQNQSQPPSSQQDPQGKQGQNPQQGQGTGQPPHPPQDPQNKPNPNPPQNQSSGEPPSPPQDARNKPDQNPAQNQGPGQPPDQPQNPPPHQSPGQPPPQNANNNAQEPGEPPPGGAGGANGQPPGRQPPQNPGEDSRTADDDHAPGQMSREEARELLDSVKGDERRMPAPLDRRDSYSEPSQPLKNW